MMTINNRELSWLAFNERVLQEAQDKSVPLLQRLRFLGIFSNNQDEFVKVRIANIVRATKMRGKIPRFTGGYSAKELLLLVNNQVAEGQKKFTQTYTEILSEMEKKGIYVINETQLSKEQEKFCRDYFLLVISQRLVPIILRKTTKMPFLKDNNIYHAVKMSANKSSGNKYAIIQIPVSSACPRFIVLPTKDERKDIIFLDDIIRLCLDEIFFMFNYEKISAYTFKIVRDAYLTLDDDISKSLVEKMETGLRKRLHGQPVKLIYDKDMPDDLLNLLVSKFQLTKGLDPGGRYHLMRDLMKFPKVNPELENINQEALHSKDIQPFSSIFKVINAKDILLNYPYHTFNHFIDFLKEAAIDPKVESIYITLYRVAENSQVINALVNAAKNGKKVVVLIELLARFDEEQNIDYSELLQKEGIKVIHGMNGVKVHSKLVLVRRKNKGYAYIGTGNFNESTANIYSDFGLFTSKPQIVQDAANIFDFLQNTHKQINCAELLVAPYHMRQKFEEHIKQEIKNAQAGKKAFIYAKFNSLTDETIIKLLYKASRAGVDIRLIIRGASCLQPQVELQSENIRVISIVDKYLEHARMLIFCNNGNEKVFISSADFMSRNLDRRVEVAVPITDKNIKNILKDVFFLQWNDNVKARDLTIFGKNNYVDKNEYECRAQVKLYEYFKDLT